MTLIFSKMNKSSFCVPLLIFTIALCPRLWFLTEYQHHPFFSNLQLDSDYYNNWAQRIASGDFAGGTNAYWASPFYAYLIALFRIISESSATFLVRLLQIVLGAVTCVLVYQMGKERFGMKSAIIGATMLSFYSFSIYMDSELLKNSLATFTLTALFAIIGSSRKENICWLFTSGILLGITTINMPGAILLTPAILLYILFSEKSIKWQILSACCLCVGMVIVVSPVTARNWIVERDFVLTTYAGGTAFYISNNTAFDGSINSLVFDTASTNDVSREESSSRASAEASVGRQLKSSEISAWWFARGKKNLSDYPLAVLVLFLKKNFLFWNWYEVPDNIDYYYFKEWSSLLRLPLVSFGFIAPLSIYGLVLALRTKKKVCIADAAVVIIFMFSVTLFMVFGRYRLPIVPLLCVYAGYGAFSVFDRLRSSVKLHLVEFTILLTLAIICNVTIMRSTTSHTRMMLADVYKKENKFNEAVELYRNIITEYPHKFDVQLRLRYAYSLEMTGRLHEAIAEYKKALTQSADTKLTNDIQMVLKDLYNEQNKSEKIR